MLQTICNWRGFIFSPGIAARRFETESCIRTGDKLFCVQHLSLQARHDFPLLAAGPI